jgi:hypothetical protein
MSSSRDYRMYLARNQPRGPLVGQLLEGADERDDSRLGGSTIRASGNEAEAQGQRTDLESAVGDEEESPEGLEMGGWGFC